jgi:hypothetical protein
VEGCFANNLLADRKCLRLLIARGPQPRATFSDFLTAVLSIDAAFQAGDFMLEQNSKYGVRRFVYHKKAPHRRCGA